MHQSKSGIKDQRLEVRARENAARFPAPRREASLFPKPHSLNPNEQGFALLITLVVVSVVLAIGLSLLFVTTRQYILSVTANESEKAFQAAQIGLECLRYHRAQPDTADKFLRDNPTATIPLTCAGVTSNLVESTGDPIIDEGDHWLYRYFYSFDLDGDKCTEPSIYVADLRQYSGTETEVLLNISAYDEGLDTIRCTPGTVCTAIFSRGYNRPCGQFDSIYSIQREVTVEF